ncbi:MAG: PD-(D/E)XK nuclease family protein [bacterium]
MYYISRRSRNVFNPRSKEPFRLSRSRIENFLKCPRCFYLDRRLGVDRPPDFPFNLNNAVDNLLKTEFDIHRKKGKPHPLMKAYGINAVPFAHKKLEEWRDSRTRGIQYLHKPTNFLIAGGVDDLWVNPKGELIIVDYKATSKSKEVTINEDWQVSYKRQVEVYQWLFRQNEFKVSDTAYFVYCNGDADKEAFDGKLEFKVIVIPYKGDDSWVEGAITKAHRCLMSDKLPEPAGDCSFCRYRKVTAEIEGPFLVGRAGEGF